MIKTIAIVVREFPGHEKKVVWFPIELERRPEGCIHEAKRLLRSSGINVNLTYTDDLYWVEKQKYTKI